MYYLDRFFSDLPPHQYTAEGYNDKKSNADYFHDSFILGNFPRASSLQVKFIFQINPRNELKLNWLHIIISR